MIMLLGQLQFQGLTERELPVLITWAGVLSPERPNLLTTHQTTRMMKFRRSRSSGTYSVNPPQDSDQICASSGKDEISNVSDLKRRVSRVESLRRLILGASNLDSKRLFDRKKHKYGKSHGVKVDKSIGTDSDDIVASKAELEKL